jgi:uncharacterized protein
MSEPIEIRHVDQGDQGAFVIERDGKRIAEQVYERLGASHINIVHTHVDAELRGQGIARKLLDAVVAWARATGTRVSASCPYAKKEFERDASIRDVMGER